MPDHADNIIHLPQSIVPPPPKRDETWIVPVLVSIVGIGGAAWGLILYGLSMWIGTEATAFIAGGMVAGILACAWRTK